MSRHRPTTRPRAGPPHRRSRHRCRRWRGGGRPSGRRAGACGTRVRGALVRLAAASFEHGGRVEVADLVPLPDRGAHGTKPSIDHRQSRPRIPCIHRGFGHRDLLVIWPGEEAVDPLGGLPVGRDDAAQAVGGAVPAGRDDGPADEGGAVGVGVVDDEVGGARRGRRRRGRGAGRRGTCAGRRGRGRRATPSRAAIRRTRSSSPTSSHTTRSQQPRSSSRWAKTASTTRTPWSGTASARLVEEGVGGEVVVTTAVRRPGTVRTTGPAARGAGPGSRTTAPRPSHRCGRARGGWARGWWKSSTRARTVTRPRRPRRCRARSSANHVFPAPSPPSTATSSGRSRSGRASATRASTASRSGVTPRSLARACRPEAGAP